jgi:hypothetical protein
MEVGPYYSVCYWTDSQYNRRGTESFPLASPPVAEWLLADSTYGIGRKEYILYIVLEARGSFVRYIPSTIHDVIYLPPEMGDNSYRNTYTHTQTHKVEVGGR